MSKKIIQFLQWRLTNITEELETIKKQGFDSIQLSPLQGTKDPGEAWWLLYQPTNFHVGNSQIGNKDDLITLCTKAHELGLEVYVDIVLRHTANSVSDNLKPYENISDEILPEYFADPIQLDDEEHRWKYTHRCTGLPMLNYYDPRVQDLHINYLQELVDCGVDGFRLDQYKHYALPCEDCNYITRIMEKFKDKYWYGEIIFTDTFTLDLHAQYMDVLTDGFPTDKSKMVTFFESHDTYHTFGYTKRMTDDMRLKEWNNLVSNCNYKSLFFVRPNDDLWKSDKIREINNR